MKRNHTKECGKIHAKDDLERHQWYMDYKACLSKQGIAVLANDDRLKRAKCHFYCMKMLENT